MSSATGIGVRRSRASFSGEGSGGRLTGILSLALRIGQARPLVALVTLAALGICLTARYDAARLLGAGAVGLLGLSALLFREPGSRVLFAAPSLALLGAYAWAGTEAVRLEIA